MGAYETPGRSHYLDDGSLTEVLRVEVEGKHYEGWLKIRRVDRQKSAFEISFGNLYHEDMSLFDYAAQDQMRLHARLALERLVREALHQL
jgi:hypothetical protein